MDGMVCGESKWKYGNGIDHIRVYTSMYTPGKPYTVDFLEVQIFWFWTSLLA